MGEESLEAEVVKLLKEYNLTVSTAESCTGGLIAGRLVNVSGVSEVFLEGFVTYSNEAKKKRLGVKADTLEKYGAVSEQTAKEMAAGGALAAGTDACIAVTGIAGPQSDGIKPVGLVYMACCLKGKITAEEHRFKGNRENIREQTVISALELLRRSVLSAYNS